MGPSRRRPGALANAPSPGRGCPPPAYDPDLRDQGQASYVALGTAAPSCPGATAATGPCANSSISQEPLDRGRVSAT